MTITEKMESAVELLQITALQKGSIWVLFVLEDMREHFQNERNSEALQVIETAIESLEPILFE